MYVRRISLLLTLLALFAFVAGIALAQLNDGTARITVDSCGQVLPGASVTLTVGGVPHVATTDAEGIVTFSDVPAGTYTAEAEMEGYAPQNVPVTVDGGKITKVAISLRPAICEETETPESCCQKKDR